MAAEKTARTRDRRSAGTDRSPATLRVRALRRSFGDVVALHGLDVTIDPGSVVGLIGPNGAGKTTASRCIAGLLKPDSGEVSISGGGGGHAPLAIATQEIELYPGLSAARNLTFFGRLSGASDIGNALPALTNELGLGPLLEKRVKDLSIGQQRLVHVAAALIAAPRLLLLDEPTAALDVSARAAVLDAVGKRKADGVAVLFSSHQLQDIEAVCDSVVMIDRGKVIASGAVKELIAEHGGARVEITVDGEVVVYDGADVPAAISRATAAGGHVDAVNVIHPSLEAVFLSLTGMRGKDIEAS